MTEEGPAAGGETPSAPATLDDVLIALQKSLSRVSERSADVPEEQPRALITGHVDFDLALKLDVDQVGDRLLEQRSGALELKLSGSIETDVRDVEAASEAETAPGAPGGPPAADRQQRVAAVVAVVSRLVAPALVPAIRSALEAATAPEPAAFDEKLRRLEEAAAGEGPAEPEAG